jgi:hypothetical protein
MPKAHKPLKRREAIRGSYASCTDSVAFRKMQPKPARKKFQLTPAFALSEGRTLPDALTKNARSASIELPQNRRNLAEKAIFYPSEALLTVRRHRVCTIPLVRIYSKKMAHARNSIFFLNTFWATTTGSP